MRAEDVPPLPAIQPAGPSYRWRRGEPTQPFTEPVAPMSSAGGGVNATRTGSHGCPRSGTEAVHEGGSRTFPAARLRPTSGTHHHHEEARP